MAHEYRLDQAEQAMSDRVRHLAIDFEAARAVSSLYRASNAVRVHLSDHALRAHDLTWTGFVVLWTAWLWDGLETRHVAASAGISKATLSGVVNTMERRGWIERRTDAADRRLVRLHLTAAGTRVMEAVYPAFNAAETEVVSDFTTEQLTDLTSTLRAMVRRLERRQDEERRHTPDAVLTKSAPASD